MGILRATFFIVGTSIGAGFISGAELVRFFRGEQYVLPVILSSALFSALIFLFMRWGKKYGGYRGAMRFLFKKAAPAIEGAVCILSLIPAAGMLAGLDSLLPAYKPLLSLSGLVISVLCVGRGTKGIAVFNLILVPLLLIFVWGFGWGNFALSYPVSSGKVAPYFGGTVYAGMNALLAAPVLMDAGKDTKSAWLPALLSACIVAGSAVCILGKIYGEGAGAISAEMPFLYVMRSAKLFYVAVALAIMTSLVSAVYPLLTIFAPLKKIPIKNAARGGILLAAFLLSRVGLNGIVSYFYPILGGIGLCLSAVCILNEELFEKHYKKIHSRRKHAKDHRRAHHKIEFEHLPAVYDQVTETRFRNDVFAHDRADPRHADIDFQHGNKGGKRRGDHKFS